MAEHEPYIEAERDSERLYKLTDLEEWGLEIPDTFKRCAICKRPADYLETFVAKGNCKFAGFLPEDPATREFIEEIRYWAHSNIELPLCEEHQDYGEIPN